MAYHTPGDTLLKPPSLTVPGLAEKRPSVLVGTGVLLIFDLALIDVYSQGIIFLSNDTGLSKDIGTKATSILFDRRLLGCDSTGHFVAGLRNSDIPYGSSSIAFPCGVNTRRWTPRLHLISFCSLKERTFYGSTLVPEWAPLCHSIR